MSKWVVLHVAGEYGQKEAEWEEAPPLDNNFLTRAIRQGDEERVQQLLTEGWDVDERDGYGVWPLLAAVEQLNGSVAQMLIDYGAKSQEKQGKNELHALASIEESPMVHAPWWKVTLQSWLTELAPSLSSTSIGLWKLLMSAGASPHLASEKKGITPFHIACARGNWPVVQFLLGAKYVKAVDMTDRKGETPLHYAARSGHVHVASLLVAHGADTLVVGPQGSPSQVARIKGHQEIAEMIDMKGFAQCPLVYMPFDVLVYIFQFLEPYDLCFVAQACKVLNEASSSDVLWSRFCGSLATKDNEVVKKCKRHFMAWLQPRLRQYSRIKAEGENPYPPLSTKPDPDYDLILKFNLLGDYGVGKTSLSQRLCFNRYPPGRINVAYDFLMKKIQHNKLSIMIQIWDLSGGDRYGRPHRTFCKESSGLVFLYDITNKKSFENVQRWKENIPWGAATTPILLLGTKLDQTNERQVSQEEAEEMAQQIGAIGWREVSSLNNTGVVEALLSLVDAALAHYPFLECVNAGRYTPPREDFLEELFARSSAGSAWEGSKPKAASPT